MNYSGLSTLFVNDKTTVYILYIDNLLFTFAIKNR